MNTVTITVPQCDCGKPATPGVSKRTGKPYTKCPECFRAGRANFRNMIAEAAAVRDANLQRFETIYNEALKAGMAAGSAVVPVPMQVVQRANPLDDTSPIVKAYEPVMDGPCGFAWVSVSPANCAFANWLKSKGQRYDGYAKCVSIWCPHFNQSHTRKYAWAVAVAKYLNEHLAELTTGKTQPRIYPNERLD